MNVQKADLVFDETNRFLAKLKALRAAMAKEKKLRPSEPFRWDVTGPLAASVHRASMDLTRALADLRRYP